MIVYIELKEGHNDDGISMMKFPDTIERVRLIHFPTYKTNVVPSIENVLVVLSG